MNVFCLKTKKEFKLILHTFYILLSPIFYLFFIGVNIVIEVIFSFNES